MYQKRTFKTDTVFSDASKKYCRGTHRWGGAVSSGKMEECQVETLNSTATLFEGTSEVIPNPFFFF